ncbi:MAG: cysteine dioxygenase family protein [Actinobacteria bacterium]|nr:cysteine dioxygenase family protein [Actinomycetota bacterium]
MTLSHEDIARPHGRDLTDGELVAVATQFAAQPELWAEHVCHDPDRRTYAQLLRDRHLDVWVLCWSRDHDTGFHDHDLSAGAVAVVAGSVREDRLALGRPVEEPLSRIASAGTAFSFTASDIHRVLHAGEGPAVTIHAYSPPLVRMGSYTVEPNGRLLRHTVSYEDELRQLEPAEVTRYGSARWQTTAAAPS